MLRCLCCFNKFGEKLDDDKELSANVNLQTLNNILSAELRKCEHELYQSRNENINEKYECKVCMQKNINTYFVGCGHAVSCENCAKKLSSCPVCNTVSDYCFIYL